MGTLSTHIELRYTADLTSGANSITDSRFALNVPPTQTIVEYSPKVLTPNNNLLNNASSQFEIDGVSVFIYIQANHIMKLSLLGIENGETHPVTLEVDRVFYSQSPFSKVIIVNPDTVQPLNLKIAYS